MDSERLTWSTYGCCTLFARYTWCKGKGRGWCCTTLAGTVPLRSAVNGSGGGAAWRAFVRPLGRCRRQRQTGSRGSRHDSDQFEAVILMSAGRPHHQLVPQRLHPRPQQPPCPEADHRHPGPQRNQPHRRRFGGRKQKQDGGFGGWFPKMEGSAEPVVSSLVRFLVSGRIT